MRKISILALLMAGCSPSQSDYSDAVARNWPNEIAAEQSRVAFFEDSLALRREVDEALDTPFHRRHGRTDSDGTARTEAQLESARYFAQATFVEADNVRCAEADDLPGENCELRVHFEGPDGERFEREFAYRFDEIDGQIEVVGSVQ